MNADMTSRRKELYSLLGDLPDRNRPISAKVVSRKECPTYSLEKIVFDFNGLEPVPGYFVKPKAAKARLPAVLYNHAHGGEYAIGKEEFINGRPGIESPPYAEVLAGLGFAGLCIDSWVFGERSGRTESSVFKKMLWEGRVLWGMMVYDHLCALDYLCSRRDVDGGRVGTLGLSMGSTMAWWLAALDTRVKVCVDICCLTDYQALIETNGLDGHGIYYYVPSLLKHFTAAQINALIAPRHHLSLAGDGDALTPSAGLDRIDSELKKAYAELGHPEAWRLVRYGTGHGETPAMRREATEYLKRHL